MFKKLTKMLDDLEKTLKFAHEYEMLAKHRYNNTKFICSNEKAATYEQIKKIEQEIKLATTKLGKLRSLSRVVGCGEFNDSQAAELTQAMLDVGLDANYDINDVLAKYAGFIN